MTMLDHGSFTLGRLGTIEAAHLPINNLPHQTLLEAIGTVCATVREANPAVVEIHVFTDTECEHCVFGGTEISMWVAGLQAMIHFKTDAAPGCNHIMTNPQARHRTLRIEAIRDGNDSAKTAELIKWLSDTIADSLHN